MAPQFSVLTRDPRGPKGDRDKEYRPPRLTSPERSQVPDLSTFNPSIPATCPVCHDFELHEFPSLMCYTQPDEHVVSFSFKGLEIQASKGCLGCWVVYTVVQRLRAEVREDPGHRTVFDVMRGINLEGRVPGFVSMTISWNGPVVLRHYEAGGHRATTEKYFLFSGEGIVFHLSNLTCCC
jgi:hypothetical protein